LFLGIRVTRARDERRQPAARVTHEVSAVHDNLHSMRPAQPLLFIFIDLFPEFDR
jgi:hypothetical protein